MKKNVLALAVIISVGTFLFTGCSKDDTTPPVITLKGNNPYSLQLQATYQEPGYTAKDDQDGDLSSSVVVDNTSVNNNLRGSYEIQYTVSDAAGNIGSEARMVNVVNAIDGTAPIGNYAVVIATPGQSPYNYNESTTASDVTNYGMDFSNFGDYANANKKVHVIINGATVTMPSQTVNCGTVPVDRTFSGAGTITTAGSTTTMILSVSETTNGSTITSTYTYSK